VIEKSGLDPLEWIKKFAEQFRKDYARKLSNFSFQRD